MRFKLTFALRDIDPTISDPTITKDKTIHTISYVYLVFLVALVLAYTSLPLFTTGVIHLYKRRRDSNAKFSRTLFTGMSPTRSPTREPIDLDSSRSAERREENRHQQSERQDETEADGSNSNCA